MKKCLLKRLRYLKHKWYSRGYLRGKANGFQIGCRNFTNGTVSYEPINDMNGHLIINGPVKAASATKSTSNSSNSSINPNYYADANGDSDLLHHIEKIFPAEQVRGFYRLVILKYLKRYPKKNGVEDLRKAETYLKRLINMESD